LKQLFSASFHHLRQGVSFVNFVICFCIIAGSSFLHYKGYINLWPVQGSIAQSTGLLYLLFSFFFFAGYLVVCFNRKVQVKRSNRYIWIFAIAPFVFALKVVLPFDQWLLHDTLPACQIVFHNPAVWFGGLFFMILTIFLLHWFFEGKPGLYFTNKTKSLTPYFVLLLCMLPLLLAASTSSSFYLMYPRSSIVTTTFGATAKGVHYFVFETCYILDFISIELFFRGLLIATVTRVLGVYGIIPVALFYFSIHLGKPMPEAISSFFGGLILGAVSYETKSIWGGWLVHCGIALLMELLSTVLR
jgi:membrane protease YdiL (CAAX protease family)